VNDEDERQIYVKRLQRNLPAIRKMAGWSAEALGQKIGMSKQHISKLETGKSIMTLVQYIAIRTMFDYEIQNNAKTGPVLAQVIKMLVDDPALPEGHDDDSTDSRTAGLNSLSGDTAYPGAHAIMGLTWMGEIFKK